MITTGSKYQHNRDDWMFVRTRSDDIALERTAPIESWISGILTAALMIFVGTVILFALTAAAPDLRRAAHAVGIEAGQE